TPFFREAMLMGRLKFPAQTPLTLEVIKDTAQGYFFNHYKTFATDRKRSFKDSERQILKHSNDLVRASDARNARR
ncbi:MAG: hypothetical protein AABW59_00455, partial [archaeon]